MNRILKNVTGVAAAQDVVDKRVLYNAGLLLGVSEFRDEQNYFLNKDHTHQRYLHGYGTVYGLKVTLDPASDDDLKVSVAPGMGVDRLGRSFIISDTQCANIKEWVAGLNPADQTVMRQPGPHSAYVVARYQGVPVDPVMLVGQPCDDDAGDEATPSRLQDSFHLAVLTALPPMPMPLWQGWQKLRDLIQNGMTPPEPSSDEDDSQAAPPTSAEQMAALLALYRTWVMEKVPEGDPPAYLVDFLEAEAKTDAAQPEILLGQLNFETTETGRFILSTDDDTASVDENNRPIVLSTQALQALPFAAAATPAPPLDIEAELSKRRLLPLVSVTPVRAQFTGSANANIQYEFECWFHLSLTTEQRNVLFANDPTVTIYSESATAAQADLGALTLTQRQNRSNLYMATLTVAKDIDVRYLRLVFPISTFEIRVGNNAVEPLLEYAGDNHILFQGYRYQEQTDGTRLPEVVVYLNNLLEPPSVTPPTPTTNPTTPPNPSEIGTRDLAVTTATKPKRSTAPKTSSTARKPRRGGA